MSNYIQSNSVVTLPYAATTISMVDSGKTFITPQTALGVDVVYTLPPVASAVGAHFRFINGSPAALNGAVTITAPALKLNGVVMKGPVNAPLLLSVAGSTSITFASGASLKGDFIDLYCDGVYYYVHAMSAVALGITIA